MKNVATGFFKFLEERMHGIRAGVLGCCKGSSANL